MSSDDFAFDAYDRLVGRNSMASSPVSLAVRNANPDRLDEVVDRCLSLIAGRRSPDEILLLVEKEPVRRPPSMVGVVSIRAVVLPSIGRKSGLAWALAGSRWPLLVFVGADAELSKYSFQKMLESLEHADIVVGKRRSLRAKRNPLSWMVRRLFGVAVSDPLSPYLGFRRDVVAGVPLEVEEPLTAFELFAKATFAFAIYDEVEINDSGQASAPLHRELLSHWRELLQLFRRPRFWRYSRESGRVRIIPQETTPPGSAETAIRDSKHSRKTHPLRRHSVAILEKLAATSAVFRP